MGPNESSAPPPPSPLGKNPHTPPPLEGVVCKCLTLLCTNCTQVFAPLSARFMPLCTSIRLQIQLDLGLDKGCSVIVVI